MSRVDESRAERRAEEARLAEQRANEQRQRKRADEASAFDRALASKAAEVPRGPRMPARPEQPQQPQQAKEPEAEPEAPRDGEAPPAPSENESPAARRARLARMPFAPRSFGQKLEEKRGFQQAPDQVMQSKAQSSHETNKALQGRGKELIEQNQAKAEARADSLGAQSRSESQRGSERSAEARGEELGKSSLAGSADKKRVAGRAGDERGGSGKESKGDEKESKSTFRLPPAALLAPPPLARPRDAQAARFAAITKEIVDKIVSRVMVGSNEKGIPEFRLELKSSVLKGLSIKVSGGRGGRIRAVFSGSDKDVLAALEQSKGELAKALEARGLTLEELVIERAEKA
ncbi:MAG: hypothetical protein ACOX6T_05720 [Myxococcales bacterium]|jgi:hypothetical protein